MKKADTKVGRKIKIEKIGYTNEIALISMNTPSLGQLKIWIIETQQKINEIIERINDEK